MGSLEALGIDTRAHDVRFVEDNWENPTLGAWGLGWEVWMDGATPLNDPSLLWQSCKAETAVVWHAVVSAESSGGECLSTPQLG